MADTDQGLPEGAVVDNATTDAPTGEHVTIEFKGIPPFGREFLSARTITKKNLSDAHIDGPSDLTFSPANGWKQDVGVEYNDLIEMFRKDKSFTVHRAS